MAIGARVRTVLGALHWRRGLRAGFAVASAMLACRALGKPMGWAALGGFEAVLVDNGGPYRSRLNTVAAVLLGGAACGIVGSLIPSAASAPAGLAVAVVVTAAVCFAVTFARVASQPIASTSVIILVLYFAGFGSSGRTMHQALGNVLAYVLGGMWAASVSLVFWPLDPFRPARLEVAAAYELLAGYTGGLHAAEAHGPEDEDSMHATGFKRTVRKKLESARAALAATPARVPARTVRARNLSVLLETADMLFATTVRMTELADGIERGFASESLENLARWLSRAERTVADGLREQPADRGASFGRDGSHRLEQITRRVQAVAERTGTGGAEVDAHIVAAEQDALQNVEIAFEALEAVWSGVDSGAGRAAGLAVPVDGSASGGLTEWDAVRQNWTLDSVMMRHALRMAVVGAVDVLLMRTVRVTHGFWLAMTSIIVLQPYSSGTVRKSLERVGGTVAGGFLAAGLAAVIHSYAGMVVVITACSVLCLATYAVDYGWYTFFLTPTFVLMSLPYLRDWRYAGVRIVTTLLGAVTAVVAMRLLWPQSLRVELGRLLARTAEALAAYLRAALAYWEMPPERRANAERKLLAPARRACGLSSQDAEEALDRAMLDLLPAALGRGRRGSPVNESALTFTTYIRRFTQCLTVLATAGPPEAGNEARIRVLVGRLERIARALTGDGGTVSVTNGAVTNEPDGETSQVAVFPSGGDLAEQLLQRMERQAGVLERAAAALGSVT